MVKKLEDRKLDYLGGWVRLLKIEPLLTDLWAMSLWARFLTLWCFPFLICKMGLLLLHIVYFRGLLWELHELMQIDFLENVWNTVIIKLLSAFIIIITINCHHHHHHHHQFQVTELIIVKTRIQMHKGNNFCVNQRCWNKYFLI